jgi:hypothetical protein
MKVAATRVMSERASFGLLEASNAKTKKSHSDDARDALQILSPDHKSTQFGDLIDPKDGVNTIIVIFSKPLLITRVHIYFERATTNPQISSPLLLLLRSRLYSRRSIPMLDRSSFRLALVVRHPTGISIRIHAAAVVSMLSVCIKNLPCVDECLTV